MSRRLKRTHEGLLRSRYGDRWALYPELPPHVQSEGRDLVTYYNLVDPDDRDLIDGDGNTLVWGLVA